MLSACGGSPSTAPTSTSPSAPAAVTAGRPTITFPADAKDVFEDQHTGDTTKETILADKVKWIESLDDAIFRGTTGTQALGFYATGMGLDKSVTYAQGFLSKKYTWQGTVRFFDRKVTLLSSGTAAVIHCSDESKGFLKDRTETVWGEASPSEEWKNGQRDRYVNGKPYTNFNLDKAGRGYFWSGYTPASNYGKPAADSCTDEP